MDYDTENVDWYNCNSAHSEPLNANQKAYAIWWLWATLGGWDASLSVQMGVVSASVNRSGEIVVRWETQSETDCAGFHVWRSPEKNGEYARVTSQLIRGGGNSSQGNGYAFVDRNIDLQKDYWYRIEEISVSGSRELHEPVRVRGLSALPSEFDLKQNYPNPFNPMTTISYHLAEACQVKMDIIDVSGRIIRSLVSAYQLADSYTVEWDGKAIHGENAPSGIYFITLKAGDFIKIGKMNLMR